MAYKNRLLAMLIAAIALVAFSGSASAHLLECKKTVNGQQVYQLPLSSGPVELHYQLEVTNPLDYSYSTVRGVEDPVGEALGLELPDEYFQLDPGETRTFDHKVILEDPYAECMEYDLLDGVEDGKIVNIFTVSWPSGYDSCHAVVVCPPAPCEHKLDIHKSVTPDHSVPGEEVEFTITVRNRGNCPITDAELTDIIPTFGEDYLHAYTVLYTVPATAEDAPTIVWPKFDLDVGESKHFIIRARLSDDLVPCTTVENQACVVSDQTPEKCDSATVKIEEECDYDLYIEKDVDRAVATPGQEGVIYTIRIKNTGTCKLTDVKVYESIPQYDGQDAFIVTDYDPAPDDFMLNAEPPHFIYHVGDLAVGEERIFEFTVTMAAEIPECTRIINKACVGSYETGHLSAELFCDTAEVHIKDEVPPDLGLRTRGFWCNQIRFAQEGKQSAQFTEAELDALVDEIIATYPAFADYYDLDDLDAARALVCGTPPPQEAQFAAQFMAFLLNVVANDLDTSMSLAGLDLCFFSVESPEPDHFDMDWTLAQIINASLAVLDGSWSEQEPWKNVMDAFNNANIPPFCP